MTPFPSPLFGTFSKIHPIWHSHPSLTLFIFCGIFVSARYGLEGESTHANFKQNSNLFLQSKIFSSTSYNIYWLLNSVDYRSTILSASVMTLAMLKSAIFGGIQYLIGTNVDWLPVVERFFSPSWFTVINLFFKLHKYVTY